jgi:excisionase family DNA binding protein
MLTVELTFKQSGREVPLDRFLQTLLADSLQSIRDEIRRMIVPAMPVENNRPSPRAVSVAEAARLLGLSSATMRQYVAERSIASVRLGSSGASPGGGHRDRVARGDSIPRRHLRQ